MSISTGAVAPPVFDWRRWPATEAFVDELLAEGLRGHSFAAKLAERMGVETSTRFKDWVDHLLVTGRAGLTRHLEELGFERQAFASSSGLSAYAHAGGIFPRILVTTGGGPEVREVAIKVE